MLIIVGVAVSSTAWSVVYHIIKWKSRLQPEWACRLVTLCHALIATGLSFLCSVTGPSPFTDPGGAVTVLQYVTLMFSLGYFVFDMVWCLYHQTEGTTMLVHHAVSLLALSRILMKGVSGTEAVAGIGQLECTNPLLQIRWFLRSSGYKNSIVYVLVELGFMATFFLMRIVGGGYLLYSTLSHPKPDLEAKVYATAFYTLSWVFMVYIFQYFMAKYLHFNRKAAVKE